MAVMEREIEAPAGVRHGDLVVADGVRIHWMEAGAGVPVVLLHGYTSCCDAGWFSNGVAKELARDHRVIGIDARGHGRSEKPLDPAKYDGDRMPADAIEVLDHLGVTKAHFHGYSMGGGIVAHLMARHPDRFITASFGGSGVREEDEALAKQAAELDPKGHDPQQEAGQAAGARRPRRRGAEGRAGRPHRQTLDRAAAGPHPPRLPDPGDQRRVRRAGLQDPAAEARGQGLLGGHPAGPQPQHGDHLALHAQALRRVDRRLRARPRSALRAPGWTRPSPASASRTPTFRRSTGPKRTAPTPSW